MNTTSTSPSTTAQDHAVDVADELADSSVENIELVEEVDQQRRSRHGAFGWAISGGMHLAALLLAMVAVFAPKLKQETDVPPTRVNVLAPPEKEKEKPKEKRELEAKVELEAPTEAENPSPNTTLDVPPEPTEREAETDNPNPKGREEAVADAEAGGSGAFMAIGAGGGGAGMFGSRSGGGRKRAVGAGGGSKGSEGAVESSLRWFKRHQSPNGSWEADNYFQNCTEGAKCEPGKLIGGSACNVAMTGYAVLCFLGAGYDHKTPNKYKATVKKGLDWLIAEQKPTGYLGNRNYEHPIATMALAEAFAMTADPELRVPTQKAVDQILAHQNQEDAKGGYAGGLGWDYVGPSKRNDSSVTGWNVMALKSALAGGLNIGNGMAGAKKWLDLSWKASNTELKGEYKPAKDITAYDKSHFAYSWTSGEPLVNPKEGPAGRESIGLVCAIFLGHTAGDTMVESMANEVMAKQVPKAFPTNAYYMYYNTMAIFQMGGDKWATWNGKVRDLLVNAQKRTPDCFDGSWDWSGGDFGGAECGRVLTTAYCTLSLEVYYRYAQIKRLQKK